MTAPTRKDPDDLKKFLKLNTNKITKIIAGTSTKNTWSLLVTLRNEYAIKTPKKQYCPKGQDEILNPHYEFAFKPKTAALKTLLENPEWPQVVYKKLVIGIKSELDKTSWY